jgi:hypothetical protein
METPLPTSPAAPNPDVVHALRSQLIGLAHDEARAGRLDTAIDLYAEAGASAYLITLGSEALAAGNVRIAIRAFTAVEWEIPRQALLASVEERIARASAAAATQKVVTIGAGWIVVGIACIAVLVWFGHLFGSALAAILLIVMFSFGVVVLMNMMAPERFRPRTSLTEHLVCDRESLEHSRHVQKTLKAYREARAACPTPEV